jgi:flagellar hook-associated protein 2
VSDISIPGVKSKYNTTEIIKNLVEVEKIPLKRMEESVKTYKTQKSTWRDINLSLSKFRDSARKLFGFQNPFNDRTAVSSDETVLTASANRDAVEQSFNLEVRKTARGDTFISKPLDLEYTVPEGRYGFRVGEKEAFFNFRGGKLSAFAGTLNERLGDIVSTQVVKNTSSSQVLVIESRVTGADNPLSFLDASVPLGEKAGLIERDIASSRNVDLTPETLRPWAKPLSVSSASVTDKILKLTTGGEAALPLTPPLSITDSLLLEMEVKVTYRKDEVYTPPSPPPGPSIPDAGSVSLADVTVRSNPSKVVLPEWQPPEPPKTVEDFQMAFIGIGGSPKALPNLQDTQNFITLKIPLKSYGDSITGLFFRNNNTYRDLEIRNIRIYDSTSRGDHRPVNPASTAEDAEILLNGITVHRKNNTIDDLIPSVTLNLNGTGVSPVEIRIEPDRNKIKESLIEFVGFYNRMIADINILTRSNENLINEITYLSDAEKEKAQEKLGLFQGDITLNQMRTTFQNIMMDPYPTRLDRDLALLAHIGISTNTRQGGAGGGLDVSRLRGYLEINENLLDESLKKNLSAVKDLFGFDTNGDLIPDSGVALAVDNYIRPMVQPGGIVSMKIGTLDTQISQTDRKISTYNQYLARFEQDLKKKYGAMEGALNSLEKNSQAIENFNKSSTGNR